MASGTSRDAAMSRVLEADPLDLALHVQQVWQEADARSHQPSPFPSAARMQIIDVGSFAALPSTGEPAWDHLGYSFMLENTRAVQIFSRVVADYRSGRRLDVLSIPRSWWIWEQPLIRLQRDSSESAIASAWRRTAKHTHCCP